MPVSWLLGLSTPNIEGFEWLSRDGGRRFPAFPSHRIVFIGLRDVDAGEKKLLCQHGIKAFSMHEVDKYGIGRVVQMALDHVNPKRDLPIHLSFDVDALDPSVAPSTGNDVILENCIRIITSFYLSCTIIIIMIHSLSSIPCNACVAVWDICF
jgi:hypothetical protein